MDLLENTTFIEITASGNVSTSLENIDRNVLFFHGKSIYYMKKASNTYYYK